MICVEALDSGVQGFNCWGTPEPKRPKLGTNHSVDVVKEIT